MTKRNSEVDFAEKVERFCSSSTRVVFALFLLGLLVFELVRFSYWLVRR